jgi:hypothetical protein
MPFRPHYNRNQPRVPAGHHDGGQWTADHSRQPTTEHEGEQWPAGRDIDEGSAEQWVTHDSDAMATPQPAFLGPAAARVLGFGAGRVAPQALARQALTNGLATFSALALLDTDERRAVAVFKVGKYSRDADGLLTFEGVRRLDRDELKKVCDRVDDVQKITDKASEDTDIAQPDLTGPVRGTAVHTRVKDAVEAFGDPDFRAEQRVYHLDDGNNKGVREKLWIAMDVFEFRGNRTACVYDIKTGNAKLDEKRMREIAEYLLKQDKNIDRIFLIQVRPRAPRTR